MAEAVSSSGAAHAAAAPDSPSPLAAAAVGPAEWTPADPDRRDRLATVPNLISLLRLAGVPLLLYLLLVVRADFWAIVVLGAGGATDWLDGKLARLLDQYSRLGALLDAVTDRLYVLATLAAFGIREIVPWWLVALLVGRDLVLSGCLPLLRARGYGPFVVTYLGKAATFLLLWAFPVLLAGQFDNWFGVLCRSVGPALVGWGTALYLYGGLLYLVQVGIALRRPAKAPPPRRS